MIRSCRDERVNESGRMPATKELVMSAAILGGLLLEKSRAYAIAIIVLKVSSMKSPSHMLRVVCGCPQKLPKEKYA